MKRTMLIGLLLVTKSVAAAVPIDQSIDADGATLIEIRNAFGAVSVEGERRGDVDISGSLSDEVERLDVRRSGNRIIVHVIYPDDIQSRNGRDLGTTLDIVAPEALSVVVEAVTANIDVEGMQGEQRLNTVSGNIETELFASDLSANSVSGTVSVEGRGTGGRVDVSSVSGRVQLESVGGEVSTENVSGSVSLSSPGLERAEIRTVSGGISVDARLAREGRLELRSTSGSIDVDLRDSPAGSYELSSFSGRIDNCFGPSPERPRFGPPSSTLQFDEANASIRVYANSLSGGIVICRDE